MREATHSTFYSVIMLCRLFFLSFITLTVGLPQEINKSKTILNIISTSSVEDVTNNNISELLSTNGTMNNATNDDTVKLLKPSGPINAAIKSLNITQLLKASGTVNITDEELDGITNEQLKLLSRLPVSYTCPYCQPEQVHIAFGEKVNELVVVWSTFSNTKSSVVEYGITDISNIAKGKREKFYNGKDEESRVTYIHTVVIPNLKRGKTYMYHVGSLFGWSDLFHFRIPSKKRKYKIQALILGDMGNTNPHSLSYIQKEMLSRRYDVVIHVGDFAYNLESASGLVGDQFMRQIQPVAANVQYMTCPGNHEKGYNYSHYRNRFAMPDDGKMYYSFNLGPIHFVSMNTEVYFDKSDHAIKHVGKQYYWLENDLKKAHKSRKKRPWIVLFGHRPFYCSNTDADKRCAETNPLRVGIQMEPENFCLGVEPLLKKYGVDLAIWGHEHSYERSYPVYDYKVYKSKGDNPYDNPKEDEDTQQDQDDLSPYNNIPEQTSDSIDIILMAPVHITTGSAGCWERIKPFLRRRPKWSAFRSEDYGYTRMYAENKTHLKLEQVSADHNGKVIDKFWLVRKKHTSYDLI